MKTTKTIVVLNEQHTLKPQQVALLGNYELLKVPALGWTKEEQDDQCETLIKEENTLVIFVSPVPYMLKRLAWENGYNADTPLVFVMANDKREKKELPNGKIIYTPAENGWYIA